MDSQTVIIAAFLALSVIALIVGKYLGWDEGGDDSKGFPHSRGRRK